MSASSADPLWIPLRAGNVPQLLPAASFVGPSLDAVATTGIAYDSVNAAAIPHGGAVVYAYIDGYYANLAAIHSDHPKAVIKTISVLGRAADMYDCEPGNGTPADTPSYWHLASSAGVERPEIYCPASWTSQVRSALSASHIAPSQYWLHSAHYGVGPHICGSCGYPEADNTQWAGLGTYDVSMMGVPYMKALHMTTTPSSSTPSAPPTSTSGATDTHPAHGVLGGALALVQAPGEATVYLTNGLSKLNVVNAEALVGYQAMLSGWGYPTRIYTLPAVQLAHIPNV